MLITCPNITQTNKSVMGVLPWWWSILSFQDMIKFSTRDLNTTIQHLQREKVPMKEPTRMVQTRLKPLAFSSTLLTWSKQRLHSNQWLRPREGEQRSCVSNPAGMEECGVASTVVLLLGPHRSNIFWMLYFFTSSTWDLRSDQYSAELNEEFYQPH